MTTISIDHVRFGDQRIDDITLNISDGEIVALLGPSGAGKSTLLRLIAGIEEPDEGMISYDGTPLSEIDVPDRKIGMVFQQNALFPHLKSRGSVEFFLKLRGRTHEVPERVREIAAITGFDLDTLMSRKPAALSGGEQQRVSIARALTRDLDVLLLDEPFAHLDAHLRGKGRVELKRLLQRYGVTTVLATHDQIEAESLSSKCVILKDGKIAQMGAYDAIRSAPHTLFVAQFVGHSPLNEFAGYATDGEWNSRQFGPYPIRRDLGPQEAVTLAVRAEQIVVDAAGQEGRIVSTAPRFERRDYLCEVTAGPDTWWMFIDEGYGPQVGDTIRSRILPEAIMYFDPSTGRRIG